jgi:hypothetical protein
MQLKIFYAHSSRNGTVTDIYIDVCEKLTVEYGEKIHIFDPDKELGSDDKAERMLSQIQESHLIIADLTPDGYANDNNTCIFNEHVLTELGFATGIKDTEQIMIIFDKKSISTNKLPIFYKTKHYNSYYTENIEECKQTIYENISSKIKEMLESNRFFTNIHEVKYYFNQKTYDIIKTLSGNCGIKELNTYVNKKTGKIHTELINSVNKRCGSIYITEKIFFDYKGTKTDISYRTDLCDELKHVELLLHSSNIYNS